MWKGLSGLTHMLSIGATAHTKVAVVRKLGFRDEGLREHYLHIDGAWRDHRTFALTTEDLRGATFTDRLRRA